MTELTEILLGADRRGFVRRECPSCHRQFKTRRRAADARLLQRHLEECVPHENAEEVPDAGGDVLTCFYCGSEASADEWLTPEQRRYLEEVADTMAQQLRYEQLAYVLRTLSANPKPTFVAVKPPAFPRANEVELRDLRPFALPCCGDAVEASTGWDEGFHCPECGVHHARGTPRTRLKLEFVNE